MRTLHVREASSTTLALTEEQAGELARVGRRLIGESRWWGGEEADGDDRTVFRLSRQFDGEWRVDIGNVVGVVGLPELTLIVEPKIGYRHFQHILARSRGRPRVDRSHTVLGEASALQQLVIEWFIEELEVLFRRGIVKDYVTTHDQLAYVRGRMVLASTARRWLQGRVVVDCEFDEFTEDNALNRYLSVAVRQALWSGSVDDHARRRLLKLARELPDVRSSSRPRPLQEQLPAPFQHYERAIRYATDILGGVGRSLNAGAVDSGTFLLNSAAVVEEGIRTVLADGLDPIRVVKTGGRRLQPGFVSVNPDLEIGPPPFTGDVKYKIGDRSWNRHDLAQAVLFAAAYRSPHAVITDFVEYERWRSPLQVGDIVVSRLHWLVGPNIEPLDSEREFIGRARATISSAMRGADTAVSLA